jgi:hypothetical protein
MTKRRVHAEPREYWRPAEVATLRAQYPHMKTAVIAALLGRRIASVYQQAGRLGLKKSPAFFASPVAGRTTGRQGVGTRFVKGQRSWNKGLHYVAGGRSAETRFRKGERRGAANNNWKPVGSFRLNSEGYLDIKVNDKGKGPKAWAAVHRLNWIGAHGPIPPGHLLRFRDGNPRNPLVENLELVTRAEHLKRNWHDKVPLPIKQLVQLRGAITRQINKRTRRERSTDE